MPGELVVDASVAAKIYFDEGDADVAAAALVSADALIAPDLIFIEMASVSAKRVRRGMSPAHSALLAVRDLPALFEETPRAADLRVRAYELACEHGFSAYDGVYLALAEIRSATLLTADERLVQRARESGLAHLVRLL